MPWSRADIERSYALYGMAVHRRCLRLLGSQVEADDALQEIFLRASGSKLPVESLEAPLAWLYRITDNHCLDLLERRRRSSAADLRTHLPATTAAGPGNLERVHVVAQVLAACPERVRRAAVLYYVDEMTQDEVAEALGVSRKTVKEKLARFKEIARGLIGAGLPDEDSSP